MQIWQDELSKSVIDTVELGRLLDLDLNLAAAAATFPLLVPRRFVDRMKKGDPTDPLLMQVLPRKEETLDIDGFTEDPLGEVSCSGSPCLSKYPGRALVLTTERCGVHCRFCFRRHLPKSIYVKSLDDKDFEPIAADPSVTEVILSGGDPLTLDNEKLGRTLHYIVKIPHVKRIRIHSRLPVVLPSRMTKELNDTLSLPKPVFLVLHVNHPQELDAEFSERRKMLTSPIVMSQTVLLKGVNDKVETLAELFEKLIDHRIVPYYLHQLDRVRGAAHFEVPEAIGRHLIEELRNRLPGYAVPKYVREIVGAAGKQVIE